MNKWCMLKLMCVFVYGNDDHQTNLRKHGGMFMLGVNIISEEHYFYQDFFSKMTIWV